MSVSYVVAILSYISWSRNLDAVDAVLVVLSACSCRILNVFHRSCMVFLLGIGPSVHGIPKVAGGLLVSVLKWSC